MGKMVKWKKILFIIICILIAVRIFYIGIRGEVDKEYVTSFGYDLSDSTALPCQNLSETFKSDKEQLNSVEFIFSGIADDKAGAVVIAIKSDDVTIYQANISLSGVDNGEWKKIYVNLDLDATKEYFLTLNATEACTQVPNVYIVDTCASEISASYQEGALISGNIAINYGYLRTPGRFDRLSIISLWILFLVGVLIFLVYFENICGFIKRFIKQITAIVPVSVFCVCCEILAITIIINSSGITFQEPTKIILYVISLISVVNIKVKRELVIQIADTTVKRVLIYALYVYAAFSLVGQRILIYPLTLKLTSAGVFCFCITVAWFIPVINSLLSYFDLASKKVFYNRKKIKTSIFVLVCSVILLLPALYNLFANNPGISSPDTVNSMIANAQHLHGMYDWHPAFYCMVLRAIEEVSNTTYAVIIVQYFFWAYVMNEFLLYLRKKGMHDSITIAIATFSGFNAGNFIHINTIWKDIPYTLSILWVFIILAKLSIDYEEYKTKWYIYVEFVVAMVGMYFYRKNGVVPFIIIALALVIVLRKNVKVWISVAISIALVFVVKGPVYNYFEVEDSGQHGMYIGLGQDILGVYYAGGEVSEDTLKMITMMTANNNAEYSYMPTWSKASYDVDVSTGEFIKNYVDTFLRNPIIMIRAVIDREDALWDIFLGQDSTLGGVNYYGTQDGNATWSENYAKRHYVSLYTAMSAATNYTASSQWISAIEWRCGLLTLLGLAATVLLLLKKGWKKHMLIMTPLVGHVLGLLLSTGWSDFRYFWPMNLMNMALICLMIVINRSEKLTEEVKL